MTTSIETARAEYAALCLSFGTDPVAEENALLSIGREHLPPCALAVLDDSDAATVEYYDWLTAETQAAQDQHDAECAQGHAWHEEQVLRAVVTNHIHDEWVIDPERVAALRHVEVRKITTRSGKPLYAHTWLASPPPA